MTVPGPVPARSTATIALTASAQDLAQLRATYGHQRADAWVGMIGTKIITQINAGPGAEEASQLIGDQEIERVERSETVIGVHAVRRGALRSAPTRATIRATLSQTSGRNA
jgi:type IV secretory pathway TraG/TraD family ATPase VirD4